ncbi:MAG: hypothetical protein B7Z75_10960 [Acidocella sp. 20-57-95]|nr:MAG: hypothetical protein B7Z75_10960 [Acidocella sp. 20-57-95]
MLPAALSGTIEDAVPALGNLLSRTDILASMQQPDQTKVMEAAVAMSIKLRDAGRVDDALALLQSCVNCNAGFLPAHKEILIILVLTRNQPDAGLAHINASHAVRTNPWMMFWEAECFRRLGQTAQMADVYARLIPSAIWFFPFEAIWAEISFEVARYSLLLFQTLNAGWAKGTWTSSVASPVPTSLIAGFLDPFGRSAFIFQQQLKRSLETAIPGFDLHAAVIRFVLDNLDSLDSVQQVIFFHVIVSLCKDEAVGEFLNNPTRLAVVSHFPGFIKNLDLHVQRTGEGAMQFEICLASFLRSSALEKFIAGDQAAFDFAESEVAASCAMEICSRYRDRLNFAKVAKLQFLSQAKRSSPAPGSQRHLFIGLFGQMRALHQALPPQLQYLKKDIQAWCAAGNLVSFGVSTWKETGAKVVEPSNRHFEFIHRMPSELEPVITADQFPDFQKFIEKFPLAGQKILALSRQHEEIRTDLIEKYFTTHGLETDKLFIDLQSEADFMSDLGGQMEAAFGNYTLVLNQGRMFHRIAAFAKLSELASENLGAPVTNFALVRPDVIFNTGSLIDVVNRSLQSHEERSVFCDLDVAAQYVDGMGDRYFIGKTRPVSKLFETASMIKEMLQENFWGFYKHRVKWHTLPRTVLYESDVVAKPLPPGPGFYFHRARYELNLIRQELVSDTLNATDETARQVRQLLA